MRLGLVGVSAERYPYVFTSNVSFYLGSRPWDDFLMLDFTAEVARKLSDRPGRCHYIWYLGRVDKRDSQGAPIVIQAGICDGDQLGTRPYVGR